ncbi:M61 family peptidase [Cytophagaceae bacterium ABcell3]|nr:M61 family peptidase [Cytophagaceae bacterium ABcell3]
MKYVIEFSERKRSIINIELTISTSQPEIILNLPTWRPGRYEKANFAKNIYPVSATDDQGKHLHVEKTATNQWKVKTADASNEVKVKYAYYANQMDAGSSWVDETLIYLNFINCLLYDQAFVDQPCTVILNIPDSYQVACGIPFKNRSIHAENYYHLVDAPLMAAEKLQHKSYSYQDTAYHLWLYGECSPDWPSIIEDFTKFTKVQVDTLGSFPENNYHFLFIILPYRHYHGVEHRNSTVITLGPDEDFKEGSFYENFLGISSHELFHSWNVCKIRPKELTPYDFTKENYFTTGYVAEGVTTYYGDLFLKRSGVFSINQYLNEINKLLKRHTYLYKNAASSLSQSSLDLWVDGYAPGIPDKKVSIYEKGALMAMLLDLKIRKESTNSKSLDDVMRVLWEQYGQNGTGYSDADYKSIAENVSGIPLDDYFNLYINGVTDFSEELKQLLDYMGLAFIQIHSEKKSESFYGIKLNEGMEKTIVDLVDQKAPSAEIFKKGDEIIAVNGRKINKNTDKLLNNNSNTFHYFRDNKLMQAELKVEGKSYFSYYHISFAKNPVGEKQKNLIAWLGNH